MNNYENFKGMNERVSFKGDKAENVELFKRAINEAMDLKTRKMEEKIKDVELPETSERHKQRMNRLFREMVGGSFIPFPEQTDKRE